MNEVDESIDVALADAERALSNLRRLVQIRRHVDEFTANPNHTWTLEIGGTTYTCSQRDTPTPRR